METWLTQTFKIKYPIIMAPMFLVSNDKMLLAAADSGIMGCIPALNWRSPQEFHKGILEIKNKINGPFGVNLIANKSNIHLKKQIEVCAEVVPDFIITSLGSPKEIIEKCQAKGTKIICDVTDVEYALKVQELGADAIIAVNSGAGGHAGKIPASILIPMLKEKCKIPVISAGGIASGEALLSMFALGSDGVSIGSPFIATEESPVSKEYKQAAVDYGAQDIVMTTKISGTPCTVINTPYVKRIGTEQNAVEKVLNKNKVLKKYTKMLTYYKGMKAVENAAFAATYKTVWCAGPSIELSHSIKPVKDVITELITSYETAIAKFKEKF
jgi:nitronate monooxygenase